MTESSSCTNCYSFTVEDTSVLILTHTSKRQIKHLICNSKMAFYQVSIQDEYRVYQSISWIWACANIAKIVLNVSAN